MNAHEHEQHQTSDSPLQLTTHIKLEIVCCIEKRVTGCTRESLISLQSTYTFCTSTERSCHVFEVTSKRHVYCRPSSINHPSKVKTNPCLVLMRKKSKRCSLLLHQKGAFTRLCHKPWHVNHPSKGESKVPVCMMCVQGLCNVEHRGTERHGCDAVTRVHHCPFHILQRCPVGTGSPPGHKREILGLPPFGPPPFRPPPFGRRPSGPPLFWVWAPTFLIFKMLLICSFFVHFELFLFLVFFFFFFFFF